jgi:hypothetical protein
VVSPEQAKAIEADVYAMYDKLRFLITDPAEAIVIHEALMSFRNGLGDHPTDVLRAEAADRILFRFDYVIGELDAIRKTESEVPLEPHDA